MLLGEWCFSSAAQDDNLSIFRWARAAAAGPPSEGSADKVIIVKYIFYGMQGTLCTTLAVRILQYACIEHIYSYIVVNNCDPL